MSKGHHLNAIQQAAEEQFSRRSTSYTSGHILQEVDDLKIALKFTPLPASAHVLDIASGAGHAGLHLASLGHRVVLADISLPMLQRCTEGATARGLHADYCRHTAEQLPWADQTFDLVTCRIAAHHFSCPATFVMETARVLKKGGKFILIDGSFQDHHPKSEEWLHRVEKLRDPSHNRFLTPEKWSWLCRESGFSLLNCTLVPKKQPDLEWYFAVADTPPENREKVREAVRTAPQETIDLLKLTTENGKTVWWWPIIILAAEKIR